MDALHDELRKNHRWYDLWHQGAHANTVTWVIFLLIALLVTLGLLTVVGKTSMLSTDEAEQPVAQETETVLPPQGTRADPELIQIHTANDIAQTVLMQYGYAGEATRLEAFAALNQALFDRQQTIRALAVQNPERVREFLASEPVVLTVPPELASLVEKSVSVTGTFRVEQGAPGSLEMNYLLEPLDGKAYQVLMPRAEADRLVPGSSVTIVGLEIAPGVVLANAPN
jgi:hypothetical protein